MYKYGIIFLLCFSFSASMVAQESPLTLTREEKLATEISRLNERIRSKSDSLNKTIKQLQKEKSVMEMRVESLKNDSNELLVVKPQIKQLSSLQKQVQQLVADSAGYTSTKNDLAISQNNVLTMNKRLKQHKNDSLSLFNLKTLRNDSATMKSKMLQQEKSLNELQKKVSEIEISNRNLKQKNDNCLSILNRRYEVMFENIVESLTIESLRTDLQILDALDDKSILRSKLVKLKVYKEAESLLSYKFDKDKVERARNYLKTIVDEPLVKLLDKLLLSYEENTNYLKNTINTIQKDNDIKAGTIERLVLEKKTNTIKTIEDYSYDYEVDLTKYSYLNSIVIKLKNRKLDKVDSDVVDLLEEL